MDLPLWARKCSKVLVRCICKYFALNAEKGPCVVDGFPGLSLCVCVYVCVYIYMYMYIYI
jgi:hypothetical protein